ncbi:hypothetical protein AB6D92_17720 [Vibrio splendidus]
MPYYNGRWHRYTESERREYGRQQREIHRQKWHEKWITKTGLKQDRNWTDAMIKEFLNGKAEHAEIIMAYKRTLIKRVENTKKFKSAMEQRVSRQQKRKKT